MFQVFRPACSRMRCSSGRQGRSQSPLPEVSVKANGNDNRGAVSTRQAERIPQMFGVGCVERLARNVAVSGGIHFRVEIAQPDINPERSQAAAERAIAAARIERDSWEIKI